jgi:hypothetical protein
MNATFSYNPTFTSTVTSSSASGGTFTYRSAALSVVLITTVLSSIASSGAVSFPPWPTGGWNTSDTTRRVSADPLARTEPTQGKLI